MFINLVYCHTGDIFPEYIYDSIYQLIKTQKETRIFIITNGKYIEINNHVKCEEFISCGFNESIKSNLDSNPYMTIAKQVTDCIIHNK